MKSDAIRLRLALTPIRIPRTGRRNAWRALRRTTHPKTRTEAQALPADLTPFDDGGVRVEVE